MIRRGRGDVMENGARSPGTPAVEPLERPQTFLEAWKEPGHVWKINWALLKNLVKAERAPRSN